MKQTSIACVLTSTLSLALCAATAFAINPSRRTFEAHCQILDEPAEPQYQASVTYVPTTGYEKYGRSGQIECDGHMKIGYFKDIAYGSVELTGRLKGVMFLDSANIQLPNQLVKLAD